MTDSDRIRRIEDFDRRCDQAVAQWKALETERAELQRQLDEADALLLALRIRLDASTAAGVESWPEYTQLKKLTHCFPGNAPFFCTHPRGHTGPHRDDSKRT